MNQHHFEIFINSNRHFAPSKEVHDFPRGSRCDEFGYAWIFVVEAVAMPSKKRKTGQAKKRKRSATKTPHFRKKAISVRGRKEPEERGATKAGASNRGSRPRKRAAINTVSEIERETRGRRLTGVSGAGARPDFQGLSRAAEADSESVEELVEEGNVFESGAVAGVEKAGNEDEREVHTRELPEDDVPDEYLEKE